MASLYTILETPEILEHLIPFWPKDLRGNERLRRCPAFWPQGTGISLFYKEITQVTYELRIKWIMQRTDIIYNEQGWARYLVAPLARVQVVLGEGRPAVTEPRFRTIPGVP